MRKNGIRVKLQDQPFQILAILLENPGKLVSREDLRQRLWPSDTFVDFDHSLNSAVKKLRQALNDDADTPRFVETVPRRGYRFIASVQPETGNGAGTAASESASAADHKGALPVGGTADAQPSPNTAWHIRHWKLGAAVLAGFLVALALGAWFGVFRSTKPAVSALVRLVPLMNTQSGSSEPSFSPDGNEIAFAWNGEKDDHERVDIYVKQIGTQNSVQITQNFGFNVLPAWSPDGRYIAFVHGAQHEKPGFYIVPALGGTPRKLIELRDEHPPCKPILSWSPDGKRLAYSDKRTADEPCAIYALSIDTLETQRLSNPPTPSVGDYDEHFSPDGGSIAFVRDTKDVQDIYVMPSSGGEAHRLTFDDRLLGGIAWMPDSNDILFSSNRGGADWGLWRIPVTGGSPQRAAVGDRAQMPVVSLKGHRLAYADQSWNEDIWRIPIGPGHRGGKPEKLIYSTLQEEGPQYSPDGKHIVFQSTRSGSFEIWRCDTDGSHLVQLTSFNGPLTGTPRWSPDSRQISFDTRLTPHPNIYVISAEGGPPRRFRNDSSDDGVASWSGDGKWLYLLLIAPEFGRFGRCLLQEGQRFRLLKMAGLRHLSLQITRSSTTRNLIHQEYFASL